MAGTRILATQFRNTVDPGPAGPATGHKNSNVWFERTRDSLKDRTITQVHEEFIMVLSCEKC